MPENLRHSLDQLGLMQIKHKACHGEPLDCLECVPLHFLLSIPIHGYVCCRRVLGCHPLPGCLEEELGGM